MSSMWQVKGVISQQLGSETGVGKQSGKPWTKGMCLVTSGDGKMVKIEAFGQSATNMLSMPVGTPIVAGGSLEAGEWNGKWYNNFRVNEFYAVNAQQQPVQQQYQPQPPVQQPGATVAPAEVPGLDSIPF